MTCSKLDRIYRRLLFSKYFIKGWGTPENLKLLLEFKKLLSCRDKCFNLVSDNYPLFISKDVHLGECRILEGYFVSPFDFYLPTLLPEESKKAHFQVILPKKWASGGYKPVCIHLAGTGDHYFWRRRHLMAKPLLREAGIGSIILESPFYGTRKPIYQRRSALQNVSDIFVMGGCLILEGLVLLQWCEREGFGPLGVSGLSMGGHMASLVATSWPRPLILVPCLSWSTASGVFIEGVMSRAINWDLLHFQYKENDAFKKEVQCMVQIRGTEAFKAGKEFANDFPQNVLNKKENSSVNQMKILHKLETKIAENSNFGSRFSTRYALDIKTKETNNSQTTFGQLITSKLTRNPDFASSVKSNKWILDSSEKYEVINFMRGIMDEFTHLENFSKPVDTSLIISVCARDDGYVPCLGVSGLAEIWPGAEVRFIDAGHISAFVLHQKEFRKVIIEAFQRYRTKYSNDETEKIQDKFPR